MKSTAKQRGRGSGGVTRRGFRPGQSGNPGGRPAGLAELVRSRTQDGAKMVELMVAILNGESIAGKKPRLRDRMDAAAWLADRGFGKAVQTLEHAGEIAQPVRVALKWSDGEPA